VGGSRYPSGFTIGNTLQLTAHGPRLTAYSLQLTAYGLRLTAYQTSYSLLYHPNRAADSQFPTGKGLFSHHFPGYCHAFFTPCFLRYVMMGSKLRIFSDITFAMPDSLPKVPCYIRLLAAKIEMVKNTSCIKLTVSLSIYHMSYRLSHSQNSSCAKQGICVNCSEETACRGACNLNEATGGLPPSHNLG
jgi:hypothetical protein